MKNILSVMTLLLGASAWSADLLDCSGTWTHFVEPKPASGKIEFIKKAVNPGDPDMGMRTQHAKDEKFGFGFAVMETIQVNNGFPAPPPYRVMLKYNPDGNMAMDHATTYVNVPPGQKLSMTGALNIDNALLSWQVDCSRKAEKAVEN
jgi:hypothetical protein